MTPTGSESSTVQRICPLCEANCGLTLTIENSQVTSVRGDSDDVFSHGFICPKGVALGELHDDANRLRTPMVRDASGTLVPATWDEAFGVVRTRLGSIMRDNGPESVGNVLGKSQYSQSGRNFHAARFYQGARDHSALFCQYR